VTGGGYLPLRDLMKLYGVSERTARRWAAEDSWRRTRTRPLRYSVADVQRSYDRRTRRARIVRHLLRQYGPAA
jgi:uncharacterized protein YjcR